MQANLNVLPLEKLMASMPGAIWLCAVPQNTSAVEYLLMHQITSQILSPSFINFHFPGAQRRLGPVVCLANPSKLCNAILIVRAGG